MRSIPRLLLLLALALAGYAVDTMPKTFGEVRTRTGAAQSGARVLVTLVGTGTNATLYQDDESTVRVNPLTSDSNGLYQFKSAPGVYDITVSLNGTVIDQRSHFAVGNLTATVSSIALTMPAEYSVAGSPITTAGTLAVTKATQLANTIWAGPTTGAAAVPAFRALVNADIPTALSIATLALSGQLTSTIATGTPPLVIASTTNVPNLYVARATLADTVTTDANLTGPITSVGNATSVAAQTGTGSTFVMQASPTLTTPVLGTATATAITSGNLTDSALTSGRVTLASTAGLLADSASLTLVGNVLSVGDGTAAGALKVNGAAGNERTVQGLTAGALRWKMVLGGAVAESGGNAGSNFALAAYDDSAVSIDSPITITRAAGGSITLTRPLAGTSATFSTALPIASGGTAATTAATARSSLSLAIYDWPMHLEAPTAKIYYLLPASNVAYTINNLYAGTVSGTCTVAVKINGTAVTGLSAVAITSTPSTTNGTAANSVSIGDTVTIVVSSPSSCVDLFLNVKMTR